MIMRRAELWNPRLQGSIPHRGTRRYRKTPRERFLSMGKLKRLSFVLDHAEDTQTAATIRLPLFTGARFSESTARRWDWIRGTRTLQTSSPSRGFRAPGNSAVRHLDGACARQRNRTNSETG